MSQYFFLIFQYYNVYLREKLWTSLQLLYIGFFIFKKYLYQNPFSFSLQRQRGSLEPFPGPPILKLIANGPTNKKEIMVDTVNLLVIAVSLELREELTITTALEQPNSLRYSKSYLYSHRWELLPPLIKVLFCNRWRSPQKPTTQYRDQQIIKTSAPVASSTSQHLGLREHPEGGRKDCERPGDLLNSLS